MLDLDLTSPGHSRSKQPASVSGGGAGVGVGQSTPHLFTSSLPWFGTMVRTSACKAAVGVCVGWNPLADSWPLSLPSCGLRLGNQRCWLDTNRVGQSISLLVWDNGYKMLVFKPAVGVCVDSNPLARAVARPQKWRRRKLLSYPEYPRGHCVFLHNTILELLLSCPRIRGGGRLLCLSLATALYSCIFIGCSQGGKVNLGNYVIIPLRL